VPRPAADVLWPALFALAAALSFAGAGICLRRAVQWLPPPAAAVLSVTFTAAFVWIVTAFTVPLDRLWAPESAFFLAAGFFAPGLARLVYYTGLARVGVARATALVSTAPIFAVALAVATLGERMTPALAVGVAGVVAGGVLLASRGRDERAWRRRDLVLPLLAALGFALRDIISRRGLMSYPEPMVAAAGATLASVVLMWLLAATGMVKIRIGRAAGLGFLALSSVCESLAYLTMWRAMATAPVSLVSPLVHAQPLFTILLAMIFLRDVERLTWRVVVASLLMVAGVAFVLRAG
jgi:drug/metabolite transporter (DMT)-like permease